MSDNEFDVIETILSGEPIPLTIGEQTWQLRQPRPLEVDKMRRAQTLAYDSVMKTIAPRAWQTSRSARAWPT